MRKFLQYYFKSLGFRQFELLGLFLLLASLLVLVVDGDRLANLFGKSVPIAHPSQDSVLHFLNQKKAKAQLWNSDSLFFFDPNTATMEDLIILGFKEKTAKTILKYRSKGGKFRRVDDLEKIYSLPRDFYVKIRPYVRIAKQDLVQKQVIHTVDLNGVDSAGLMEIPIMRGFMARKILKYRDFLGGYYKIEQLLEVYGIDSIFYRRLVPYLRISADSWQKIAINDADYNGLHHPYIDKEMRKEILAYRRKMGDFRNYKDLLELFTVDSTKLQKLLPYLNFH